MEATEVTQKPSKPEKLEITPLRVSRADLDNMSDWLLERLAAVYPRQTRGALLGWLRGCYESNEYLFIHTPLSVALVQMVHEPMVTPRAEERFVFMRTDKGFDQAASLYSTIKNWCVVNGLDEYIVSRATDVDDIRINQRLGKIQAFPLKFVVIPITVIN
jgi:hypothetical protein